MVTEITHVDEPSLFVDQQRIGPYSFGTISISFKRLNLKTGQKLDSNNILLEITIMEGITMNIETYLEDLKIRDKRNKKS